VSLANIPRLLRDGALYGGEVYTVLDDKPTAVTALFLTTWSLLAQKPGALRPALPEKCGPFSAASSRYQIEGEFRSWGWRTASKRQAP